MEKINIAQLLKDCPQGMELDCTMLDDVVFEKISFGVPNYPIVLNPIYHRCDCLPTNSVFGL